MATINQYGRYDAALTYKPRTGAYGILVRDGRVACARIGYGPYKYDLPGGAVDPGETPEQAVVREFGEETGLAVTVVRPVTDLMHYFIHDDGTPYNNHCYFFEMALTGEIPEAKCEADHELVWLEPLQVVTRLKNDGYAWAFVLWLRNQSK
ncbi:hypothetical protein AEAC466_14530 [Asticcacaulis sp. AC466]|uniref:NUDIX domain-containing protein n=1 Tax=Asticcacaulis sp. AC466 TaxID=1282362 RepID=UPI0003C3C461|nr:NUDIX domain-containing protein [Asticcacaulis sp. AC466]ESQ83076.1 hypothetical protein AEAC466_14530 [Asticcacaulis sp. AC466]